VAIQAGIAIDNAQLHERALHQKDIEQDLELANEVQRAFLPKGHPEIEDYEFFDYYRPANHVGGDYYDYVTLPDGRTAVIVADVVGHGVAAAMMMAKVAAEAKYCLASETDPSKAITRLNDRISNMQIERFTTVIMVVLDPKKHEVTIVNAGHMAPIWRRANHQIEEPGGDLSGLPVGIMQGLTYGKKIIQLAPGDMLTLYTDGINEAMDPSGRQYTIERLRNHLRKADNDITIAGDAIVSDVLRHVGQGPQADDMCIVMLRRI
jgi:serine phosphatase RsbU (regulator of sigma subunit)